MVSFLVWAGQYDDVKSDTRLQVIADLAYKYYSSSSKELDASINLLNPMVCISTYESDRNIHWEIHIPPTTKPFRVWWQIDHEDKKTV